MNTSTYLTRNKIAALLVTALTFTVAACTSKNDSGSALEAYVNSFEIVPGFTGDQQITTVNASQGVAIGSNIGGAANFTVRLIDLPTGEEVATGLTDDSGLITLRGSEEDFNRGIAVEFISNENSLLFDHFRDTSLSVPAGTTFRAVFEKITGHMGVGPYTEANVAASFAALGSAGVKQQIMRQMALWMLGDPRRGKLLSKHTTQ